MVYIVINLIVKKNKENVDILLKKPKSYISR